MKTNMMEEYRKMRLFRHLWGTTSRDTMLQCETCQELVESDCEIIAMHKTVCKDKA